MRPFSVALLLLLACDKPAINGEPAVERCTDCEIVLDRVGTLSDAFDPGVLPDNMLQAVRDSAGRLYTVTRRRDAVLVYGRDSTPRRIGQPGDGPGEFRRITRIFLTASDSLVITDLGLGRVSVYSPDLQFVRMHAEPAIPMLVLKDGRSIVTDYITGSSGSRHAMRLHAPDGALIRGLGPDTQVDRTLELASRVHVAPANAGGIWSVTLGRYTLERWDIETGQLVQTVTVNSDWFKETADYPVDERTRPVPVIEALREDAAGLLWVVIRDADLDWVASPQANIERPIDADEYERTYDWVVEAVDPKTQSVIASQRYRNTLWSRPGSPFVISQQSASLTGNKYDVWTPTLVQKTAKK